MHINRTCRDCEDRLVVGLNWTEGQVRARSYICRSCLSERGKKHYQLHAERAAELQRSRLKTSEGSIKAKKYRSAYYAKNRGKWEQYHKASSDKARTSAWHRAGKLLTWTRSRAAKRGLDFDLTREWIEQRLNNGRCDVTDLSFVLSTGGYEIHPFAPSIDRINPKSGYTQDNCRIVVWIYNLAKSEWSDSVVTEFAAALIGKNR